MQLETNYSRFTSLFSKYFPDTKRISNISREKELNFLKNFNKEHGLEDVKLMNYSSNLQEQILRAITNTDFGITTTDSLDFVLDNKLMKVKMIRNNFNHGVTRLIDYYTKYVYNIDPSNIEKSFDQYRHESINIATQSADNSVMPDNYLAAYFNGDYSLVELFGSLGFQE